MVGVLGIKRVAPTKVKVPRQEMASNAGRIRADGIMLERTLVERRGSYGCVILCCCNGLRVLVERVK